MRFAIFSKKDISLFLVLLIWLAVIVIVVCATLNVEASSSKKKLPVYCVETTENKVAITFNCAWSDKGTDKLLKILGDKNIKCTFFFTGSFAEKYPEAVRKIYNAGHELGNHSMRHSDPVKMEYADIVSDISACNKLIFSITGIMPSLYRAPSGSYDNKTVEATESLGMTAIQWNVDSIDWKNLSPAAIISRIIPKTVSGSIILFHLGKENTLNALPEIIDMLEKKGYAFTSAGDLLLKEENYIDHCGKQRKKHQK